MATVPPVTRSGRRGLAWTLGGIGVVALLVAGGLYWRNAASRTASNAPPPGATVLRTVSAAGLTVTIYGSPEGPHVGRSHFVVQFRDATSGAPVDVGTVTADGTMTMPGMAMTGSVSARRLPAVGQFDFEGEYKMGGAWTFSVAWSGPHGSGRTTFQLEVQ